jgi:hypothetical protein
VGAPSSSPDNFKAHPDIFFDSFLASRMVTRRDQEYPLIGPKPIAAGDKRWKQRKDTDEEAQEKQASGTKG